MENRLFVLGASDPEMEAIEELLRHAGERYIYATRGGHRVTAGEAYRMDPVPEGETPWGGTMYLIECGDSVVAQLRLFSRTEYADTDPSEIPSDGYVTVLSIDHHRPGDPGFGRAPTEFLAASSLGQVISLLARLGAPSPDEWWEWDFAREITLGTLRLAEDRWEVCMLRVGTGGGIGPDLLAIPRRLLNIAAGDHCLGHAYAGRCPGVDRDELLRHRIEARVAHMACPECGGTGGSKGGDLLSGYEGPCHCGPHITVESVLADIERAHQALLAAPELVLERISQCPWHASGHRRSDDCCNESGTEYADESCSAIVARDMRGQHVDGLPDAGTFHSIAYIADGLPSPRDARRKVVCSGESAVIEAFLRAWAPGNGLVDCYGDPARGFAGGYLADK